MSSLHNYPMQVHTPTHMYTHIHTNTNMHPCLYTHMYMCACLYIPMHVHADMYTQAHILIHSNTHECTHAHTQTHACTYKHTYTNIHILMSTHTKPITTSLNLNTFSDRSYLLQNSSIFSKHFQKVFVIVVLEVFCLFLALGFCFVPGALIHLLASALGSYTISQTFSLPFDKQLQPLLASPSRRLCFSVSLLLSLSSG